MKKKYIYMLVPLCGLLLFIPFYLNFASHYNAMKKAEHDKQRQMLQEKANEEAEARKDAILKNNEEAEKRKKERQAHEAMLKAEQDALDKAGAEDQKAFNDKQKNDALVTRLQKEIKAEQAAITDLENQKQEALKERAFLKDYVREAEGNRKSILDLLDKLKTAEQERADEAAKKAAAANNS
jgi:colicin import membrane protein